MVDPCRSLEQIIEDIPALVTHFVRIFSRRMAKQVDSIPPETMAALQWHSWPGNIRELQNLVERAVILSQDGVLPNPLQKRPPSSIMSGLRAQALQSSMTLEDSDDAARQENRQSCNGPPTSGSFVLDVAQAMGLRAGEEFRFVPGTARISPWCATRVIMIAVVTEEMHGSDRDS